MELIDVDGKILLGRMTCVGASEGDCGRAGGRNAGTSSIVGASELGMAGVSSIVAASEVGGIGAGWIIVGASEASDAGLADGGDFSDGTGVRVSAGDGPLTSRITLWNTQGKQRVPRAD